MTPEAEAFIREFLMLNEAGIPIWRKDPREGESGRGKHVQPGAVFAASHYSMDGIYIEPASAAWVLQKGEPPEGRIFHHGDLTDHRAENLYVRPASPGSIDKIERAIEATRDRLDKALDELNRIADRLGITPELNLARRHLWEIRFPLEPEC